MVRIFSCHNFTRQDVLSVDTEPTAMFCLEDRLFVATDDSQIQVYCLQTQSLIAQFPTVNPVRDIIYCKKAGYIAALEHIEQRHDISTSVQVYFCWEQASISRSVRVNIAGHMTSLRHEADARDEACLPPNCVSHVKAIGIPLKDNVRTFAVNQSTGELALAVRRHMLVYSLSCKKVASTEKIYRDMKCILDVQFTFDIFYLSFSDDFILCASKRQCQVVRLTTVDDELRIFYEREEANSKDEGCIDFTDKQSEIESNTDVSLQGERLEGLLKWISATDSGYENENNIIDDDDLIEWDFAEDASIEYSNRPGYDPYVHYTAKSLYVASIHEKGRRDRTANGGPTLLLSPDVSMPEVSVEYEDHCLYDEKSSQKMETRIIGYFYSQLSSSNDNHYIKPILIPVYQHSDTESGRRLAGMFCMLSSGREGRLYRLLPDGGTSLLTVYPFTADIKQVYVSDSLLYAISDSVLKIFTCHCIADTLLSAAPATCTTKVVRRALKEPSMVGLEAFMNVEAVMGGHDQVVLMSKANDTKSACWSVYVLQKTTLSELDTDFEELSERYNFANENLLLEVYLFLISHAFTRGATESVKSLIKKASLMLGLYIARYHPYDMKRCHHYLQHSEYKPKDIMTKYVELFTKYWHAKDGHNPESLLKYLDSFLLTFSEGENSENCSNVGLFYSISSPVRFLYLILTHKITKDSLEDFLCEFEPKVRSIRLKSLIKLSRVTCDLNPFASDAIFKDINEEHLKCLMTYIPECLHDHDDNLSQFGQILKQMKPELLLEDIPAHTINSNAGSVQEK